jgi:serine/threonine protein kinase
MLAGTWPFRGKTALDVRYAVVYHQPKPIAEARGEDSPQLRRIQEILDKALAKSPDNRYQRIEDMRSELQELMREVDEDPTVSNTLTDAPSTVPNWTTKATPSWTAPRRIALAAIALNNTSRKQSHSIQTMLRRISGMAVIWRRSDE